eukprot:1612040-Rhodomonas_salina.2
MARISTSCTASELGSRPGTGPCTCPSVIAGACPFVAPDGVPTAAAGAATPPDPAAAVGVRLSALVLASVRMSRSAIPRPVSSCSLRQSSVGERPMLLAGECRMSQRSA